MADRVLLAEDLKDLRESYSKSLEEAGFEVTAVDDGDKLYEILKSQKFDVLVADSNMPSMSGYDACRKAILEGILDNKETLIIGMSSDSENQENWRGVAHLGAFYEKYHFYCGQIGEKIMRCLRNFKSGGIWKEKMPEIGW